MYNVDNINNIDDRPPNGFTIQINSDVVARETFGK